MHPQPSAKCKIVIRLRGPRSSNQPYIRQNSSQLVELSAQLIPSPKTRKRKGPHLKSCTCLNFQSWHHVHACRVPYSHLSNVEKARCCRSVQAMNPSQSKRWVPETAGSCSTIDRSAVKPEKGQRFTLLKRITNYKSVNSESIGGSVLSHRVPSRGSCHLVDSTWVTHLNWNNFSNFVVECIGRDNDPKTKT